MTQGHKVSAEYHVADVAGWSINHRLNSQLPGYLMIAAEMATNDFSDLPAGTLSSLGVIFATVQRALIELGAKRVYIGRYGHSPGYPIHFHAIPIYDWVEDRFWKDDRYRMLDKFAHGPGETATDGAELTLFVWREFCERPDPPPIEGPSVMETIAILRQIIAFQPK